MTEISNKRSYSTFLYSCIILSGLSILPIALRNYSLASNVVPIIILCLCVLAIIIIRPAYLNLRIINNQLIINNNPFTEDNIIMNWNEYGGYKFDPISKGTGRKIIFFRNTTLGLMQSKEYRITLLSKEKVHEFELLLTNFKAQTGT